MNDYDVIVIGGGPAGCYAALTAATKGCSVAIFEEHGTIGGLKNTQDYVKNLGKQIVPAQA